MESIWQQRASIARHAGDFSNVIKAFVGAGYLAMPYGFAEAGIAAALGILFLVIMLNLHCCHLIIRCKSRAIEQLIGRLTQKADLQQRPLTDDQLLATRRHLDQHMTFSDIGREAHGRVGKLLVDVCLVFTQFAFCVNYFVFIGNAIQSVIPCNAPANGTANATLAPHADGACRSVAPDLRLLVVSPFPLLLGFALIRKVRHLAPVGVVSNFALFGGFLSLYAYFFADWRVSEVQWINWATLPIFFGQVVCAFEGIGLVIPLHASMEDNRHLFRRFLVAALAIVAALYAGFGALGYVHYGNATVQMINNKIEPRSGWFSVLVNCSLTLAILLTFPLQFFPVIEIVEGYLFLPGQPFGPSDELDDCASLARKDDLQSLDTLHSVASIADDLQNVGSAHIPPSVASWKRNVVRILLLVCAAGLSVLLKDSFAYVVAITGAVGCTPLAYVFPCFFHLRLRQSQLLLRQRVKNYAIIAFGFIGGAVSLYASIQGMIAKKVDQ